MVDHAADRLFGLSQTDTAHARDRPRTANPLRLTDHFADRLGSPSRTGLGPSRTGFGPSRTYLATHRDLSNGEFLSIGSILQRKEIANMLNKLPKTEYILASTQCRV